MSRRVHPSFERLLAAFWRQGIGDQRAAQAEIARRLAVIQVHGIKSPPRQLPLPT